MEWTKDQLDLVERCGATMMPFKDINTIFNDVPEDIIMSAMINPKNEFYQRYHKGRLMQTVKVREAIFEQANNGSSPAQNLAVDLINKLGYDNA